MIEHLIEIHLSRSALRHNFKEFEKISGRVAPVIKTNAYGHGLEEIVSMLETEDIPFFVVDSMDEAIAVRNCGSLSPVLTINYVSSWQRLMHKDPFTYYTITSEQMLDEWCQNIREPTKIHLKIDTGMYRQGIMPESVPDALDRILMSKYLILDGVCTHLADADAEKIDYTRKQITKWNTYAMLCKKRFPKLTYIHISNTSGHAHLSGAVSNVSRLGVGLYGLSGNGYVDSIVTLKPVMEVITNVTGIKEALPGARIGYNGIYVAESSTKVATVPIGYGLGLDRRLSNKGKMIIGNNIVSIIGRVSMNITILNVSEIPDIKLGTLVTVISSIESNPNSIVSIAKLCETIPQDITVGISPLLPRVITD